MRKKRFWNINNNIIGAVGLNMLKWGEDRNIIVIVDQKLNKGVSFSTQYYGLLAGVNTII